MAKQRNEYSSFIKSTILLLGSLALVILWMALARAADVTTQTINTTTTTTTANTTLVPPPASPVTTAAPPSPAANPMAQVLLDAGQNLGEMQTLIEENEKQSTTQNIYVPPAQPILPSELSSYDPAAAVPAASIPGSMPASNFSTFGTPQDPAFQNMTKKMYPMSPSQIQALRDVDLMTQRAIAGAAPVDAPTPTLSSQTVSLSPGSTPPVIRLSTGYVSSVVFVDETGAPWPVGAYSIGDPNSFNIQWDTKSNLLLIQGQKPYASGNMAVRLQDMPTPVMLTLVTDQNNVDYRIDFRVQGRGPQAQASIIGSSLPQNADVILMNLLEGVPPQGSQPLHIIGGPAEGWLQGNTLYLRTPLTILSPAWMKTMTSADGTKVYQFSATPMILASQGGQPLTLRIEGL